ncbi:unnamed protein product, partial [Owenia fusiformis]
DDCFQANLKEKLSKTIELDTPTSFTPLDRFIDLNDWSNSWGTMDYVFTVFCILTIVSFGMSSYLTCKMMVCSTTLIQNAQGLLISEQNRKAETKVEQYGLDVDTMIQVMVLMIISFMTIYLCVFFWKKFTSVRRFFGLRNSVNCELKLVFLTSTNMVELFLSNIPLDLVPMIRYSMGQIG